MAAFDANLGTASYPNSASSETLTTSAAAAAGTLIVLATGCFTAPGTVSVTGGGLTWTVDKQAANGQVNGIIVSAYAASGLASGTVLTVNYGASVVDKGIAAMSFTGMQVADAGRVDTSGSSTTGSGDTWTSGAVTTGNANDVLVGLGMADGASTTAATPNSPWNEVHDFNDGSSDSWESVYQIVSSATSYTAGGDFTTNQSASIGLVVAYKQAASASAITAGVPLRIPNPRVGPMAMRHTLAQRFRRIFSGSTGSVQTVAPAAINSTASVTATVVKTAVLSGTINSTAAVTATVVKTAVLTGTVNSKATVTATVVKTAVLSGTVNSKATFSATIVVTRRIQPTAINGVSTVTGTVVKTAVLTPAINSTAVVTATVTGSTTPSALPLEAWLLYRGSHPYR